MQQTKREATRHKKRTGKEIKDELDLTSSQKANAYQQLENSKLTIENQQHKIKQLEDKLKIQKQRDEQGRCDCTQNRKEKNKELSMRANQQAIISQAGIELGLNQAETVSLEPTN